jgi:filamentous hemagglutinin family protein
MLETASPTMGDGMNRLGNALSVATKHGCSPRMVNPIKFWLTVLPLSTGILTTSVLAQITPTLDSTGTIVSPNGNQIDISGGKLSGDGTNLFHSFQQFNLSTEQTATFRSSPGIQNILGRVVGGDASVINGLIRVTGSPANLYLMNPAGILFGPNARLDVPGSFTATTATGIGFGNGWFNAFGSNDYSALVGNPQSFAFALSQPGAIANLGNLTVNPGQSLTLLGGTVLNAGTLSAPGGTITIASVAGGSLVRISQEGALLNLELKAVPTDPSGANPSGKTQSFTPVSLPALLTGGNLVDADTVTVAPDGTVRLARSQTPVATTIGATTVSGSLNVAGNIGGSITVLGNAIALQTANLDASGAIAGGTIRIGGDFRGLGTLPTATQTWIDQNSMLNANALLTGNGGQVVVWADQATRFDGTIQARGGMNSGNGGTVEVSGKDTLIFRGDVDTSAPHGTAGTLLLDPQNIVVVNGTGAPDDAQLNDGQILAVDGGASTFTISEQKLESLAGVTNVTLEATNNITINGLADNALIFQPGTGSVVFIAGGAFSMNAGDTIRAEQRSLSITAASITAGSIDTSTSVNGLNGGAITLMATSGAIHTGALNAETTGAAGLGTGGNITLTAATGIQVNGTISTAANAPIGTTIGNGGNVSLSTTSGNLTVAGDVQTFSLAGLAPGDGGTMTLSAPLGAVTAGNLASYSTTLLGNAGNAGAIAVTAGTTIALNNLNADSLTLSNAANTGNGASVTLSADRVNVGQINTASTAVSLFATQQRLDQPITITGNEIDLTGGANSVIGGTIALRSKTLAQNINVGGATDAGVASLDLTTTDLAALSNGFTSLTLGQPGATGTLTLFNSVTNTGSNPFNSPVLIAGAGTLVGPNQATTWNITGANAGNLNGSFANGLTFSNISNLTGGNANNNFVFASNAATISGAILGGTGTDTLNYSAYTGNHVLDLAVTKAVGIETILGGTGTNTLIGDNLANTWTITGSNTGTINGITFTNFQNLTGGSSSDIFTVPDGATVTGTINGGAGTNTLNYSTYNSAIAINLGTNTASATGGISNIGVIQGGPNPNNTLTGTTGNNTFNITGTNAGSVGGVSFSGFTTLQGQAGNDTFAFNGGTVATIDGGAGSNTIVGANTTSTWNLTGATSGNLNGATFTNIQNLIGGTGNDTFAVGNGVTLGGTIDGGGGTNTLDYSAFTSPLTVNLAALGASNIAAIIGTTNAPSTLIGANTVNTWSLTGTNAGTLNGTGFSQFQNLVGGTNTDTFTIPDGASVTGIINGGAGINTLNYSTYNSAIAINLGTNTASATGGISNIGVIQGGPNPNNTLTGTAGNNTFDITGINAGNVGGVAFNGFSTLQGQAGNDTFAFNGGTIATINGGGGSNTIAATNTANTWTITGSNAGQVNSSAFSNIQNLTGGNQAQTVTFSSTTAQLSGNIIAGAGDLTLAGDKINIQGTIAGSGNLLIQPLSTDQRILLGGTGTTNPVVLTLTSTTLNSLQNGFNSITIGRVDGSDIDLASNVAFTDPVTLRSPNASIQSGSFNLIGTDNAAFTLLAGQSITTANISTQGGAVTLIGSTLQIGTLTTQNSAGAGGNLTLEGTRGAIATGAITTSGTTNSGTVSLTAKTQITTGAIDTSSAAGNGGNVTLQGTGAIQTSSINTQAGVSGGNVDITTTNFFRATNTFSATDGSLASISSIGSSSGGSITIRHGGNGLTPFDVGNGTINGTAGAITSGSFSIAPFRSFPGIYTLGNLAILTREMPREIPAARREIPAAERSAKSPTLPGELLLDYKQTTPKITLEEDSVLDAERHMTREFQDYLTLSKEETNAPIATIAQARTTLRQVQAARGIKPALLYVYFVPSRLSDKPAHPQLQSTDKTKALMDATSLGAKKSALKQGDMQVAQLLDPGDRPDKDRDTLELVLVTADEQPIHRHLWDVTRAQVLEVVQQLQQQVTDGTTSPEDYLPPAQQLYNWIVNPVRADLERQGIQNIVFILDDGLRSMPVVTLHNGHHFLVEDYSVSLMPSFSLTQLSDGNIHDMKVLAMGASEFKEQSPLPAVPLEVSTIAQKVWTGKSFLNNDFTIQNLKAQRSRHPFSIVHLATHGKFLPGKASNSYIQFSDQKLQLDQVRQLGLHTPPVELLVFSACTTALGDEKAELGFAGMAVQAGVISSLASLWAVSDDATLGLMTEFYHQLRSSHTKVEALRQAQLAMINGKIRVEKGRLINAEGEPLPLPPELAGGSWDFTHPRYWSAFTLIGSPW